MPTPLQMPGRRGLKYTSRTPADYHLPEPVSPAGVVPNNARAKRAKRNGAHRNGGWVRQTDDVN